MPFDASPLRLTRAERDAARGKLGKMRGEDIAALLARWTREALEDGRIVTLLNREALYRHILRRTLVLQGWRWTPADMAALRVVQISLELLRVQRPAWNEGQPDHTIEGGALIERTRCASCHKPLPEERRKFCSDLCADSYHARLHRMREADERQMAIMASRVDL